MQYYEYVFRFSTAFYRNIYWFWTYFVSLRKTISVTSGYLSLIRCRMEETYGLQ